MVFTIYGHGSHLGHVTWTIYILSFPLPKEAPHEIWLSLAKWIQRRRCSDIVNGWMPEHGYKLTL